MWTSVVEAVASGVGASLGVGALARRWFRHAVQDVVDASVADVIRRQQEFERRQGQHLDRQDQRLERIERAVRRLGGRSLPFGQQLPGAAVTVRRRRVEAHGALE